MCHVCLLTSPQSNSKENMHMKINSYQKFEQTQALKRKRRETHDVGAVASHDISADMETGEHNYCKPAEDTIHTEHSVCFNEACQATIKNLTAECTRLRAEVCQLRDTVNKLSFKQEAFKDNDDMVQTLTGLPSYAKLMVVFTFLSEFLKVGPGLSPFHAFLMTLMRMRLNLPLHFFTYFFMSQSLLSVGFLQYIKCHAR